MLAGGELFTNIAYAQLILENARIYEIDEDIVDHIFNFLVRDFSASALQMIMNHSNSPEQEAFFLQMLKKPVRDQARFDRLWNEFVFALKDEYYMNA